MPQYLFAGIFECQNGAQGPAEIKQNLIDLNKSDFVPRRLSTFMKNGYMIPDCIEEIPFDSIWNHPLRVKVHVLQNCKCPEGTKPLLIFAGDAFEMSEDYRRLKSLLIDFFQGPAITGVRLAGLEHVLHFIAVDGKATSKVYIFTACLPVSGEYRGKKIKNMFFSFRVLMKKSGCRTPRIELEEIGPSFDFMVRRTHLASDDLDRFFLKQPKVLKAKKKKNISHDAFGTKFGRIHTQKQDLSKLQIRKMIGLKKRETDIMEAEGEHITNTKKAKQN
ncbi:ribosome production factor 2 homolog [Xenopus laevis]|uniref:Ribosome production factor 2 homolog n=1 Tax=Xenopus laevis TaxID=8355 RepID=A0A8J1KQS6_XENLA|nr:ribosome production factor 2 homolog [Xenopus laevis]